jgi:hypothetical protein
VVPNILPFSKIFEIPLLPITPLQNFIFPYLIEGLKIGVFWGFLWVLGLGLVVRKLMGACGVF